MPRQPRSISHGHVYHVLNRASGGRHIFRKPDDYLTFELTLRQAQQQFPIPLLAYALMPDRFHLLLWARSPAHAGRLSDFMRWLTVTHTQRHHARHRSAGTGHIYQGRFKTFPIQPDFHVRTAARFLEQFPLREQLVKQAEKWPWSSLHQRLHSAPTDDKPRLAEWPDAATISPRQWLDKVDTLLDPATALKIQTSITRGTPFGSPEYIAKTVKSQNLDHTIRPRGRPRKIPAK